jgi:hypothetical protein
VTAPDQCCRYVRKFLPGRRPHVTQSGHFRDMSSWFTGRRELVMNGDKEPEVERTNVEIVAATESGNWSCGVGTRLSGKL